MTTLLQAPVHGVDPFGKNNISHSTYSVPYEPPPSYYQSSRQTYSSTYDSDRSPNISSPIATRPKTPLPSYLRQPSLEYSATAPSEDSFDDEDEDDDMAFPSFSQEPVKPAAPAEEPRDPEPTSESASSHDQDMPTEVNDDIAVQQEPTQHVDYLAHEWREEDIWASWSYVSKRRGRVNNHTRLENASWRQWMKTKNELKTVSPESLNWLKDCDVTWLYGPLQIGPKSLTTVTPPPSRLSHSSSFIAKKSNLKKKSASAVMLEKSRSQHSLLQRAGEIIRVQQASSPAGGRPGFKRHASAFVLPSATDSSVSPSPPDEGVVFTGQRTPYSYTETPTPNECKHVLFDNEVRQVRAVESDDDQKEEVEEIEYVSDEDDDGGLMMAPVRSRSKNSTPRGSFSNDNKTIVPLPSTTLKYRTDTPEPVQPPPTGMWSRGRKLSPSPSQETLRPSRPSQNYILEDDHELSDQPWQAPLDYESEYYEPGPGMRRTESGMFMPYDDLDEEEPPRNSLIGQALNAVNTFKDIAHVVWNVGWYKSGDNS